MSHLHFDCFAGVCGSMVLGALVDAGLPFDDLRADLDRLKLSGFDIRCEKVKRRGIAGTLVTVDHPETHVHRGLAAVEKIIQASDLPAAVRETSIDVFRNLARAEAKIHATTVEKIHFHEVGAIDAIVDIVGSVAGLARLGVTGLSCSPVNTGAGFVDCAHGRMPVPAPATAELLVGVPVFASTGIEKELTTPTGAALVTTLAASFGERPPMSVDNVGYGAGTHDLPISNLLRVFVGTPTNIDPAATANSQELSDILTGIQTDTVVEARTAIDDMSPELVGHLFDRLLEAGALDVYATPVYMKKNRPGQELTVLMPPARRSDILAILFRESSGLGARVQTIQRAILPRESLSVPTEFGSVGVKVARLDGKVVNIAPEYEDCLRLARAKGQPLKRVFDAARRAALELKL